MLHHAFVTGPDPSTLLYLRSVLGQLDYHVETAPLERGPSQLFCVAVVDCRHTNARPRLRALAQRGLVMALCPAWATAQADGADVILDNPELDGETLAALIKDGVQRLGRSVDGPLAPIIGRAPALLDLLTRVDTYATSNATVLISGETGTGKELLARGIHQKSKRSQGPFVALNCAAIPETLLESELFGHTRGAFTGAVNVNPGRLAVAEGGTLFLDEISELTLQMQAKLLRVLQEREYTPVGGGAPKRADVRILAATNRDLEIEAKTGEFRADLYWRLETITVEPPPLRHRMQDVLPITYHVIDRTNHGQQRTVTGLEPAALAMLMGHDWPGNVRELENTIERAVLLRGEGMLQREDIILRRKRPPSLGGMCLPPDGFDLTEEIAKLEVLLIHQALEKTRGNRSAAARLLNIDRTTLLYKLRRGGDAR